ncbi:hypothetical protein ACIBM4_27095 [Streptomyces sp. NPDC050256]|uniref:hypothetical protein n=1 Tax=unclassified Streptomyces TaxID=2593676 RepID=UPI0037BC94DC
MDRELLTVVDDPEVGVLHDEVHDLPDVGEPDPHPLFGDHEKPVDVDSSLHDQGIARHAPVVSLSNAAHGEERDSNVRDLLAP